MNRYQFLKKEEVYQALNKLRAAFLAAKDGAEVDELMKGILTHDERMKVGRRIIIAQMLLDGMSYNEIISELKVGSPTIRDVDKKIKSNPACFKLINTREEKVEKTYTQKAYTKTGGSKKLFKSTQYTGYKRKDVKR
jgi:uncharacterized protein YerC